MTISKLLLAVGAVALSASPALAAPANPAASLSVAKSVRSGTPASAEKTKLAGGGFLIAAIAIVAVIAGVVIIADSDDDSDSN